MEEYHKIQTLYKRDPDTKFKTLLDGQFALPEFEYLAENQWIMTEKVDGTNIRIIYDHEKATVTFAGKTDRAQIPPFLLRKLEELFPPGKLQEVFPETSVCLYGEGYGAKIQKCGGNYRKDQSFVLFDVKVDSWWLQRTDVEDIANRLGIEVVPVKHIGTLADMIELVRVGFKSLWGDFDAEGLVARPIIELKDRAGRRIITKLKCKDFIGKT